MTDPDHYSPIALYTLLVLAEAGGEIVHESGRATSVIVDRLEPHGYRSTTVSTALRELEAEGHIERELKGKRTFRIALTDHGRELARSVSTDFVLPAKPEPAAEVEPEPEPEAEAALEVAEPVAPPDQRHVVDTILAAGVDSVSVTNSNGNGVGEPAPSAIAQALLRQAVRVLSDSDTASLMAERDALRAHNEVLVERSAHLRDDLDRAQAELRELREIVHRIEVELTPILTGRHERADWLDGRTRTDLLLLVGQAARWVAS